MRTEADAADTIKEKWGKDFDATPKRTPAELASMVKDVTDAQAAFAAEQGKKLERGMHNKGVFASGISFKVAENLPPQLAHGPFRPGAELKGVVRYSNGSGRNLPDGEGDRRGLAFRISETSATGLERNQDFLLVTGAQEFIGKDGAAAVAGLSASSNAWKPLQFASLLRKVGIKDGLKMAMEQGRTATEGVSLAADKYFSRVPYQLGEHAVKFQLVPKDADATVHGSGDDSLREDLRARLAKGPVTYTLQAIGYINKEDTPMDDARAAWKSTKPVTIGELTIPRQTIDESGAQKLLDQMNPLSFSPWHRWDDFDNKALKPLGDVNEVRKAVYEASAKARGSGGAKSIMCPLGYG